MFFVFIGVCIAIYFVADYFKKKNMEKQRRLLEAAEQLPSMIRQAVASLPTEADALCFQQEKKQLEAFGAKFDVLEESGAIRSLEDMSQERITCANGHHFLFQDFDRQGGCCPMCKTSAFSFDEPIARRYWFCTCGVIGIARIVKRIVEEEGGNFSHEDMKPTMHWFRDETDDCPLCRWAEDQGIELNRTPLTSIVLNVEKSKARQGTTS